MKTKQLFFCYFFIAAAIVTFSSCQKVINIDLNSVAPQIVIEGGISDQPGPYSVSLTKTVNFSDSNVFPPVDGAAVTINDNVGNSETLTEASPGVYKTSTLIGVVGRVYTLSVTANGKNYQAVSTLSVPVNIDTLTIKTSGGFGGGGGGGGGSPNKSLDVQFTDPSGIANYYRLIEFVNGVSTNAISITSDNLRDGAVIHRTLRTDSNQKLYSGDTVTVQLESIDYGVYNYFRTFNNTGGGAFNASSPANPVSNISNGALGYFSAYALRSKKIGIP